MKWVERKQMKCFTMKKKLEIESRAEQKKLVFVVIFESLFTITRSRTNAIYFHIFNVLFALCL